MKQADLMAMFKEASKSKCISIIVLSPDTLLLTPLTFSPNMTPENTNEDPKDPEPVDGDTQMKYSLIIA
jgi:hypothetical protein